MNKYPYATAEKLVRRIGPLISFSGPRLFHGKYLIAVPLSVEIPHGEDGDARHNHLDPWNHWKCARRRRG